jgi:hypothetical protein
MNYLLWYGASLGKEADRNVPLRSGASSHSIAMYNSVVAGLNEVEGCLVALIRR